MKKLKEYTDKELQTIIDNQNSISAILRHLGISETCPHNRKILKDRLKELDVSQYEQNKKGNSPFHNGVAHVLSDEEYFAIGKHRRTGHGVKTRLIKHKGFQDVCSVCNIGATWNGFPLSLHVDHINGNCFDNRLENLRIICPNCHSQTDTFGSKNVVRPPKPTCLCGKILGKGAKKYCLDCYKKTD